jgi:hypothetical protein
MVEQEDPDDDKYYNWEEQDWLENWLMYEYGLEYLEELPQKEKM